MFSGSCPEFGVSGSGIVREWKRRPENGAGIDFGASNDAQYQHSFVGPLSMSKGCDLVFDTSPLRGLTDVGIPDLIYRGKPSNYLLNIISKQFALLLG